MKRVFVITLIALFSITMFANAQTQVYPKAKTVTKFLGIPVDGTKNEMIQQLINKGFDYNRDYDCLEGEFNGYNVRLHVVTNNNKVYRIMVEDAYPISETNIKIRFNKLCQQFKNNQRYISLTDYEIADNEDISYEILVNNKRYQASYYQTDGTIDSLTIQKDVYDFVHEKYGNDKNVEDLTKEESMDIAFEYLFKFIDKFSNNSVWFMINESYGKYKILMYYDNLYNQANGDDL